MIAVVAFEPFVLGGVALAGVVFGVVALLVVWWMVKSAVRLAFKAVVFAVLTLGALLGIAVAIAALGSTM